MRTFSFHSGAAFEAGELGHRNGEGPDGTEVVDTREEPRAPRPASSGRQRGIAGFLSGGRRQRSRRRSAPRRVRPETMQFEHEGQTLTVFKGTDSALLPTYALP